MYLHEYNVAPKHHLHMSRYLPLYQAAPTSEPSRQDQVLACTVWQSRHAHVPTFHGCTHCLVSLNLPTLMA
jgi:hypothetical protein